MLEWPRRGAVNVHASLLPRWRGAAPIHRAILAGDERSGVSIMQLDAGLDTGPVYTTATVAIKPTTTVSELHDTLAHSLSAVAVQGRKPLTPTGPCRPAVDTASGLQLTASSVSASPRMTNAAPPM